MDKTRIQWFSTLDTRATVKIGSDVSFFGREETSKFATTAAFALASVGSQIVFLLVCSFWEARYTVLQWPLAPLADG